MSRTNHTAYDRLVAAGAPPLPGDRFYRVRETLENILVVEIREPGRFGGSRRLASAVVVMRGDLVIEDEEPPARSPRHLRFEEGPPVLQRRLKDAVAARSEAAA